MWNQATPRIKRDNLKIKPAFPAWKVWVLQTQAWEAN